MYVKTFEKMGLEAKAVGRISSGYTYCADTGVIQEEIFGSGYAAGVYISQILKLPKDKRVYVIGESGLEQELDAVGVAHAGGTVSSCPIPRFR